MLRIITPEHLPNKNFSDQVALTEYLLEKNANLHALLEHVAGSEAALARYLGAKDYAPTPDLLAIADRIGQLFITHRQLEGECRRDFRAHYSGPGTHATDFADLKINWPELQDEIIDDAPERMNVAFKMIHRFGPAWYLTAQRVILEFTGPAAPGAEDSSFREDACWFDIRNDGAPGNRTPGAPAGVTKEDGEWKGPDYFQHVRYDVPAADLVRSIVIPAAEFRALVGYNTSPEHKEPGFSISLAAISYDMEAEPDRSPVKWPHAVALFANHDGQPRLEPANVVAISFSGNAANYDSLCPPSCNRYHWPADLPRM